MQIAQELVQASIVVHVFGLGLRGAWTMVMPSRPEAARVCRRLIARDALMPAIVMSVLSILRVPGPAIVGATMLAISPGTLLVPQGMLGRCSRSNMVFGASVVAVLGSIVTLPFWMPILCRLYLSDASVAPAAVAQLAGILFLLPLGLGALVRRFDPAMMEIASGPVIITGDLLLWLALIPLLGDTMSALPQLGSAFVIVVISAPSIAVLAAIVTRHWTRAGAPETAPVFSAPHPGFALLVTASNFAGDAVLPAVVLSFVGRLAASMLHTLLTRHADVAMSAADEAAIAIAQNEPAVPRVLPLP